MPERKICGYKQEFDCPIYTEIVTITCTPVNITKKLR